MKRFIRFFNLPKFICNHLIGQKHTDRHQMIAGCFVMFFGVSIVKITAIHPNEFVHFAGDVFGYFIHGLGAIPFFKKVENNVE